MDVIIFMSDDRTGVGKLIAYVRGDLLASEADALVNPVNTVGVMGKGLAAQFKQAYPDMFAEYRTWCRAGALHVGKIHVWRAGPKLILNFPTKHHWRDKSKVEDIRAGLDELVLVMGEWEVRSIAIPALGCGLGGLRWSVVEPLIVAAMAPFADEVDVSIYPPEPVVVGG